MIAVNQIIATVALAYGFHPQALTGADRSKDTTLARHVAMYLAAKYSGMTVTAIGAVFGQIDHTTVIYGRDKIAERIKEDEALRVAVQALAQSIEFKMDIASAGTIEVLPLARRIYVNPRRGAISANLYEITALASVVLDLWEVAETVEELFALQARQCEIHNNLPMTPELSEEDDLIDARRPALERAITDTMAALRGEITEGE